MNKRVTAGGKQRRTVAAPRIEMDALMDVPLEVIAVVFDFMQAAPRCKSAASVASEGSITSGNGPAFAPRSGRASVITGLFDAYTYWRLKRGRDDRGMGIQPAGMDKDSIGGRLLVHRPGYHLDGRSIEFRSQSGTRKKPDQPLRRIPVVPANSVPVVPREAMMKIVKAFAIGENHGEPMVACGSVCIKRLLAECVRNRIDEECAIQNDKNPRRHWK